MLNGQDSDLRARLTQAVGKGFSVIPVGLDKRPLFPWKKFQEAPPDRELLRKWWSQNPPAWAVVTGAASRLAVLDFDGEKGAETLRRLNLNPHVRTGSGGYHLYLRHPGWAVRTVNGKASQKLGQRYPGLDIRADGGYAVFLGANKNGEYRWLRPLEPDLLELLPADLREFLGLLHPPVLTTGDERVPVERLIRIALNSICSGMGRNNAGFNLAIQLRDNNYGEAEALLAMSEFSRQVPATNNKGEVEPYTDGEFVNSVRQAYSRSPRSPWNGGQGKRSDVKILPTVVVNNRELRDVSGNVLAALQAGNDPPELFVRGGCLVHVASDEQGRHFISQVTEARLRGRMTRCADFRREWKSRNGEKVSCSTNPPLDVVRDLMALTASDWKFRPLESLTESPILRSDGSILAKPGYDPGTQVVYAPPPGFSLPRIPADPSPSDVADSVALIDEALDGFPFTDSASKANAFGMLLTPLVRRAIGGNVPIALIDAPQAGTGKSLLAEVVSIIHTGADASMKPAPRDEEEFRKALGAILLAGNGLTIFDNVTHRLDSASLALAVTASTWTDRVLGESKLLTLPQRTTWIATGNNLTLGADIPRRCYWIRLDAATSQPWERTGFRHPDLKGWVRENRGRLLAALLTICRAWFSQGKPTWDGPVLGSFESWCRTVGGILSVAGVDGFLQNRDDLYQQADPSQEQWEAFLQVIHDHFDGDSFTISTLVDKMRTETTIQPAVPDEFADDDRRGNLQRRLGRAFRERLGRRYGPLGLHILKAGLTRNKVVEWCVRVQ